LGVLFDHIKDPKTHAIIGAAMEVHRELGNGFLEAVYQEALEREFSNKDIPFQSQPEVQISYKGQLLNKAYYPDFICFDNIVVELKAMANLSGTEVAQLINYLKATSMKTGLLLNFGTNSLEFKRLVYSNEPKNCPQIMSMNGDDKEERNSNL
jgi:GxxExxY protein